MVFTSFRRHIFCKIIALTVCSTFIWQSIGPIAESRAQTAGAVLPSGIKVPVFCGEVVDSFKGPLDKTIIHIRDAHCDYSAQRSISGVIGYFRDTYGIDTIALEGGSGDYDLSVFTSIKDSSVREKVADYFVKAGEVNGAEFYAINNPLSVALYGIEDPALYIENLKAYRDSLKFKAEADKCLNALAEAISKLRVKIYPEEFKELDSKMRLFREGRIGFDDYAASIAAFAQKKKIDFSEYPNIKLFYEAMGHENGINYAEAERDRNILIDMLNKRLSRKYLDELAAKTVAFNDRVISSGEYCAYLSDKAELVGIELDKLPNFKKYTECAKGTNTVNKRALQKEFSALEERMCGLFLTTEAQKNLHLLDRRLFILQNLFSVSLVKEDWDYYLAHRDDFNTNNFLSFLSEKNDDSFARLNGYRERMEKFYSLSLKRDDVFIDKIIAKLKKEKQSNIILVTGGFHQDNIKNLFKDKGYSYIEVLPKVDKENGKNPYFKLLSGGVDPITKAISERQSNLQIASYLNSLGHKDAFDGAVQIVKGLIENLAAEFGGIKFSFSSENAQLLKVDGKQVKVDGKPVYVSKGLAKPAAPQSRVATSSTKKEAIKIILEKYDIRWRPEPEARLTPKDVDSGKIRDLEIDPVKGIGSVVYNAGALSHLERITVNNETFYLIVTGSIAVGNRGFPQGPRETALEQPKNAVAHNQGSFVKVDNVKEVVDVISNTIMGYEAIAYYKGKASHIGSILPCSYFIYKGRKILVNIIYEPANIIIIAVDENGDDIKDVVGEYDIWQWPVPDMDTEREVHKKLEEMEIYHTYGGKAFIVYKEADIPDFIKSEYKVQKIHMKRTEPLLRIDAAVSNKGGLICEDDSFSYFNIDNKNILSADILKDIVMQISKNMKQAMKNPKLHPSLYDIEKSMKPGMLSGTGFLSEREHLWDVINDDNKILETFGISHDEIASALNHIFEETADGKNKQITMNDAILEVTPVQTRGVQLCPWGSLDGWHEYASGSTEAKEYDSSDQNFGWVGNKYNRRGTRDYTLKNLKTGESIDLSDMMAHLIGDHHFFEGHTEYRCEPEKLLRILGFTKQPPQARAQIERFNMGGEVKFGMGDGEWQYIDVEGRSSTISTNAIMQNITKVLAERLPDGSFAVTDSGTGTEQQKLISPLAKIETLENLIKELKGKQDEVRRYIGRLPSAEAAIVVYTDARNLIGEIANKKQLLDEMISKTKQELQVKKRQRETIKQSIWNKIRQRRFLKGLEIQIGKLSTKILAAEKYSKEINSFLDEVKKTFIDKTSGTFMELVQLADKYGVTLDIGPLNIIWYTMNHCACPKEKIKEIYEMLLKSGLNDVDAFKEAIKAYDYSPEGFEGAIKAGVPLNEMRDICYIFSASPKLGKLAIEKFKKGGNVQAIYKDFGEALLEITGGNSLSRKFYDETPVFVPAKLDRVVDKALIQKAIKEKVILPLSSLSSLSREILAAFEINISDPYIYLVPVRGNGTRNTMHNRAMSYKFKEGRLPQTLVFKGVGLAHQAEIDKAQYILGIGLTPYYAKGKPPYNFRGGVLEVEDLIYTGAAGWLRQKFGEYYNSGDPIFEELKQQGLNKDAVDMFIQPGATFRPLLLPASLSSDKAHLSQKAEDIYEKGLPMRLYEEGRLLEAGELLNVIGFDREIIDGQRISFYQTVAPERVQELAIESIRQGDVSKFRVGEYERWQGFFDYYGLNSSKAEDREKLLKQMTIRLLAVLHILWKEGYAACNVNAPGSMVNVQNVNPISSFDYDTIGKGTKEAMATDIEMVLSSIGVTAYALELRKQMPMSMRGGVHWTLPNETEAERFALNILQRMNPDAFRAFLNNEKLEGGDLSQFTPGTFPIPSKDIEGFMGHAPAPSDVPGIAVAVAQAPVTPSATQMKELGLRIPANPEGQSKVIGIRHHPLDENSEVILTDDQRVAFRKMANAKGRMGTRFIFVDFSKEGLDNRSSGLNLDANTESPVAIINSNMSDEIQAETRFHEDREIYWMQHGLPQQRAHVVASAECIMQYSEEGTKLTPYHDYLISKGFMTVGELAAIIGETERLRARTHHNILNRANRMNIARTLPLVKLQVIKTYENKLRETADNALKDRFDSAIADLKLNADLKSAVRGYLLNQLPHAHLAIVLKSAYDERQITDSQLDGLKNIGSNKLTKVVNIVRASAINEMGYTRLAVPKKLSEFIGMQDMLLHKDVYSPGQDNPSGVEFAIRAAEEIDKRINSGKDEISILIIGTGSGLDAMTAYNKVRGKFKKINLVAVDVKESAVQNTKLNFARMLKVPEDQLKDMGIDVRLVNPKDRIVSSGRFDVILFNAPDVKQSGLRKTDINVGMNAKDFKIRLHDIADHIMPDGFALVAANKDGISLLSEADVKGKLVSDYGLLAVGVFNRRIFILKSAVPIQAPTTTGPVLSISKGQVVCPAGEKPFDSYLDVTLNRLEALKDILRQIDTNILRNLHDNGELFVLALGATPVNKQGKSMMQSNLTAERQSADRFTRTFGNINLTYGMGAKEATKLIVKTLEKNPPQSVFYCALSASILKDLETNTQFVKNLEGFGKKPDESVEQFLSRKAMLDIVVDKPEDRPEVYMMPYSKFTKLGLLRLSLSDLLKNGLNDKNRELYGKTVALYAQTICLISNRPNDVDQVTQDLLTAAKEKDPLKFFKDFTFRIVLPPITKIDFDDAAKELSAMAEVWRSL